MDYKYYVVLFILFIITRSTVTVTLLSKINGTSTSNGDLTDYGIMIQALVFVLLFICVESLVGNGYL